MEVCLLSYGRRCTGIHIDCMIDLTIHRCDISALLQADSRIKSSIASFRIKKMDGYVLALPPNAPPPSMVTGETLRLLCTAYKCACIGQLIL